MLAAVHLYDQNDCRGIEIDNVFADRLLAVELHPKHQLATQPEPQPVLRVGHRRPQAAGDRLLPVPTNQRVSCMSRRRGFVIQGKSIECRPNHRGFAERGGLP